EIALVESFADQAVNAIENARLFAELNDSNASLKEALEQQTATARILEWIARTPGDATSVLAMIAETAGRLAGGTRTRIYAAVAGQCALAAIGTGGDAASRGAVDSVPQGRVGPLSPYSHRSIDTAAVTEGRLVYIPDLSREPTDVWPHPAARAEGERSMVA